MKKKFTISAVLILTTVFGFAQCPTYFARNNGNGQCGAAQVKMYFSSCPATIPSIDSIYSNGVNLNISQINIDASKCASQGYISYCISGNIPPVNSIQVYFNFGAQDVDSSSCTVSDKVVEAGPTPVVLSSFEVKRSHSNAVVAEWKTEQEINADKYEIQRSANNSSFETIGTVYSKNSNSSSAQYYSFTDNSNDFAGVSLYRIKMIDKDNSFTYSLIKTIKGSVAQSDFSMYPNPSTGNAKVSVSNSGEPTNVMVFDNSGRLVQQARISNGNSYNITNLQKGIYIIKVTNEKTGSGSVKKLSVIN